MSTPAATDDCPDAALRAADRGTLERGSDTVARPLVTHAVQKVLESIRGRCLRSDGHQNQNGDDNNG